MAKRLREDSLSSAKAGSATIEVTKSRSQSLDAAAHTPKYASVEPEEPSTMRCLLPPHKPLSFTTYDEYESHYQQAHTNRCTDCRKNFPTSHFVDVHIAENHDPIVAAKREAGEKTYACFVEGCDKACLEWKKRRSHLVDKHGYPKNYDFLVVDHGIDGRRSMLRAGIDARGHRKSSRERDRRSSSATEATQTTVATSVKEPNGASSPHKAKADSPMAEKVEEAKLEASSKTAGVDDLTASMSSLKMVPRTVTFANGKGGLGLRKLSSNVAGLLQLLVPYFGGNELPEEFVVFILTRSGVTTVCDGLINIHHLTARTSPSTSCRGFYGSAAWRSSRDIRLQSLLRGIHLLNTARRRPNMRQVLLIVKAELVVESRCQAKAEWRRAECL